MPGRSFKKEGVMPDSFVEKTQRWVTLCANAEPLIGPLPAAQDLHAGLKATATELGSLEEQIQDLQGQTLTLVMRRQELIRKGIDDADRLKFHLRALLGPKNPELLKLGIRPRRTSTKARPKAPATKGSEGKSVSVEA
jgi:hypothetical protein